MRVSIHHKISNTAILILETKNEAQIQAEALRVATSSMI